MSGTSIPCPQCRARGLVPGAAYGSMVACRLCKAKCHTTIEHCIAQGWPADVLLEVTRANKGDLAAVMLVEVDE